MVWGKPYKPYVDGWGERKQPPDEWEWDLDAAWIMLIPWMGKGSAWDGEVWVVE